MWEVGRTDSSASNVDVSGGIELNELTDLLALALSDSSFDVGNHGTLTSHQMRLAYERGDDFGLHLAHSANIVVPEARLSVLVDALGKELDAFIEPESQRLGTGLVSLMGGALDSAEPTVAEFAGMLVRAGLILGSRRAIEILSGWINGEPYRYRMMMLLTGVGCDQPLSLEEGVRVTQLPTNSADIPASLPWSLTSIGINPMDFMGRALVEIDCTASPALYRPARSEGEWPSGNLRHVWASGRLPSLTTDMWRVRFTDALSLACNHHVRWTHVWRDASEIRAFSRQPGMHEANPSQLPDQTMIRLEQRHLEAARDLDARRDAHAHGQESLNIAISRWISSKRPFVSLADLFIDLRIALEALYLSGAGSEMRFRLALFGAWDLGTDFQKRRRYYDLLRQAYDLGSKAVHTGNIEDTAEIRANLADAHAACREAILKRLAEFERQPWDENKRIDGALGAFSENSTS